MNPTARKLTALSLAAVMGLGLAACSGGSGNGDATGTASPTPGTTAEPTSYADQIVVGITAEPKYNAPGMGPAEVQVSQQIFEGLVRTGDDGSIEPVLATDWTISDDGLTYTFNLVQGVKFSNGEDVEPSDWVWSFYRARDYETSTTAISPRPSTPWRPPTSRWSSPSPNPTPPFWPSWAASTWCWATSPMPRA